MACASGEASLLHCACTGLPSQCLCMGGCLTTKDTASYRKCVCPWPQNFDGLTRQLTETLYKSLENFQARTAAHTRAAQQLRAGRVAASAQGAP